MQITYFSTPILFSAFSSEENVAILLKGNSKALTPNKNTITISILPGFEIFSLPFSQGLCQLVDFQVVWQPFSSSLNKEQFPIFSICLAESLPIPLPLYLFNATLCNKARARSFGIYLIFFLFCTCCICKCLLIKARTLHFIEKWRPTLLIYKYFVPY